MADRASARRRAMAEPLLFVALAILYVWVVKPTGNDLIRVPYLAIVVLIPITSNLLHGDRPAKLGLRLDNLGASAREVGIATVVGAALILAIGWLTDGLHAWSGMWAALLTYPGWALAQQYAMQSFTYQRMREAWERPAVAAALTAVLFGLVHAPNLALALLTAIGGYVWCRLFERHPNLFTLALSHGWLAVLIRVAWRAEWLRNLRIGPSFWTWTP